MTDGGESVIQGPWQSPIEEDLYARHEVNHEVTKIAPVEPVNTEALLQTRGKTHGPYSVHAAISQELKAIFVRYNSWYNMTVEQRETLDMIAHKIGRILAGDPDYADHWDDIAGYAKLVSKSIALKTKGTADGRGS